MTNNIQQCVQLIKDKQYQEAIENLNDLSNSTNKRTISELKLKCYLKLKDFKLSIIEIKKLIKLNPSSTKHYLKLGNIYEILNQYELAFQIYSNGLKIKNEDLKIINQLKIRKNHVYSKFSNPIDQSKPIIIKKLKKKISNDPLIHLPLEIYFNIFNYLSLKDVLNCLLVNKSWYQTLISNLDYYQKISFNNLTIEKFRKFLFFFKKSKKTNLLQKIEFIKIKNIIDDENFIWQQLIKNDFLINELQLNFVKITLFNFLETLENYERSEIAKNLKILKLSINTTPLIEDKIFEILPKLEELNLICLNGLKNNAYGIYLKPKISTKILDYHSRLTFNPFLNLKKLILIGNSKQSYEKSLFPLEKLFSNHCFLNLNHLTICGFSFKKIINNGILKSILELKNLKEIHFEDNKYLNLTQFLKSSNNDLRIEKLTIREYFIESTIIQDILSERNIQNLSELKELDLYNNSLNFPSLINLLSQCDKLMKLNLGSSSFLKVPTNIFKDSVIPTDLFFNFNFFLKNLSINLVELYLTNAMINDYSLKLLKKEIISNKGVLKNLKVLDLSFNNLTMFGILNFFGFKEITENKKVDKNSSMSNKVKKVNKKINNNYNDNMKSIEELPFKLDKLILNRIENLSPQILKKLIDLNYVKIIENDCLVTDWLQFGKNSFKWG